MATRKEKNERRDGLVYMRRSETLPCNHRVYRARNGQISLPDLPGKVDLQQEELYKSAVTLGMKKCDCIDYAFLLIRYGKEALVKDRQQLKERLNNNRYSLKDKKQRIKAVLNRMIKRLENKGVHTDYSPLGSLTAEKFLALRFYLRTRFSYTATWSKLHYQSEYPPTFSGWMKEVYHRKRHILNKKLVLALGTDKDDPNQFVALTHDGNIYPISKPKRGEKENGS